jgi:hypothetical protein
VSLTSFVLALDAMSNLPESARLPTGHEMADALLSILNAWDQAQLRHHQVEQPGSMLWFDREEMPLVSQWPARLCELSRNSSFLLSASISQMIRALAALYEIDDRFPLTLGHLPIARSILEGAGQVEWLLGEAMGTDAPIVLNADQTAAHSRRRCIKAFLLHAASLEQQRNDARHRNRRCN